MAPRALSTALSCLADHHACAQRSAFVNPQARCSFSSLRVMRPYFATSGLHAGEPAELVLCSSLPARRWDAVHAVDDHPGRERATLGLLGLLTASNDVGGARGKFASILFRGDRLFCGPSRASSCCPSRKRQLTVSGCGILTPTVDGVRVLSAGPTDRTFPNDTPDGGRPTLEGSGLEGGLCLVAVPLGPACRGH